MVSLDDYRWLVSEDARPWLDRASADLAGTSGNVSAALVARYRKQLSAERTHLVLEQAELRSRAREKFSRAEMLFYTRVGLEQATDELVASSKAKRFGGVEAADLCCGIGGDLMALAARGPVVGVDADPITALLAEANCRILAGGGQAALTTQDAAAFDVRSIAAWHIDPDRRAHGGRTTRIERYEPPLETIECMLGQNPNAAIKLAPATIAPDSWRHRCELAWYGSRGECRQQVAWFGLLTMHLGQRSATIVDAAGEHTVVGIESAVPIARAVGQYVYEPHAAVLAAHLSGALCQQHDLAAITRGVAYLTSDQLNVDGTLSGFEVLDMMSLDLKRLKAYLQQRQIGRLEIKKRGLDLDPERLRRDLNVKGDNAATLILLPIDSSAQVLITKRLAAAV